ncbi:MAG TPA: protein translocase subunit SecD, partial [Candidatus Limnocylindria bacterium]|nr:protein translocase subunit SecD [Candidatus Limnocylindria bacterium]
MSWRRLAPWVILVTFLLAIYIDIPREWLPSSFPGSNLKTVLGLDLQGGVRVTLNVQPLPGQTVTADQVETARNIIERRVSGI